MNDYVYSDNNRLTYNIENVGNGENTLYPHELAFLLRVTFCHLSNKNLKFCFRWEIVDVRYPELLLYSLIERGYIILSDDWKVLPYIKYRDMQQLVKLKNIKCEKYKIGLIKQIKELYSLNELRETLDKKYFILTEKGMNELSISGFKPGDEYHAWNLFYDKFGKNKKKPIIKEFAPEDNSLELLVNNGEILCRFQNGFHIAANRYNRFNNFRNMNIKFFNNRYRFEKVIEYRLTEDKKYLMIVQEIDTSMKNIKEKINLDEIRIKDQKIKVTIIDVNLEKKCLIEQIPYSYLLSAYPMNGKIKKEEIDLNLEYNNNGIICGEFINYYFSTNNVFLQIMFEKYYSKNYDVKLLPSLLKNDVFSTYKIKVKEDDAKMKYMIMYLYNKKLIQDVGIKGYSLNYIVNHFNAKLKCQFQKFFSEIYDKDFLNLEKEIKEELLISNENLLDNYLKTIYPSKVIDCYNCLMYYTSDKVYQRDTNLMFIYNNEKIMDKEYTEVLYEMRKEKLIPTKWKSEFELYLIISKYYPDSIFQYTSSWLGKQSLDIYVPSIRLAIEYQGIQHYKAIDFFGGKGKFKIQKKLDFEKKKKLKKEGIKLLEWKYDRKVSEKEVHAFFRSNFIDLPNIKELNTNLPFKNVTESKDSFSKKNSPKKRQACYYTKFNIPIGVSEKILMYQKDGTFIKGFNTISESEKFSGISSKKISDVINGYRKTYKGYVWIKNTKV